MFSGHITHALGVIGLFFHGHYSTKRLAAEAGIYYNLYKAILISETADTGKGGEGEMHNRQLETFLKVVELGSFSKASQALYITPSAVIQQMNSLEADLQVKLLTRTKRGVCVTAAGEYLCQEGPAFIEASRAIRRQLHWLGQGNPQEICVGTALLSKCRLFYELWMRYNTGEEKPQVKMKELLSEKAYEEVDIIESLLFDSYWQKKMEFLELCTVPIACAVPRGHELASRRFLSPCDLRGRTLVTIEPGMSEVLDRLREEALAGGVHVVDVDWYHLSVFSMCVVKGFLLQTPACWHDIHPDLVTIPCEWKYALPYGLLYQKDASQVVCDFLDFVRELCGRERFRVY